MKVKVFLEALFLNRKYLAVAYVLFGLSFYQNGSYLSLL